MRLRFPCSPVALAALLGLCSLGGLCGPTPAPPPEGTTQCVNGLAAPADGMDTVILGRRLNGQFAPLADGDPLGIISGDQGGQHVFVLAHHYSAGPAAVWTYDFGFYQDGDGSPEPEGSTLQAVEVCGAGWTESETPVFMYNGGNINGVMRLNAMNQDTGDELSAEVAVRIK